MPHARTAGARLTPSAALGPDRFVTWARVRNPEEIRFGAYIHDRRVAAHDRRPACPADLGWYSQKVPPYQLHACSQERIVHFLDHFFQRISGSLSRPAVPIQENWPQTGSLGKASHCLGESSHDGPSARGRVPLGAAVLAVRSLR